MIHLQPIKINLLHLFSKRCYSNKTVGFDRGPNGCYTRIHSFTCMCIIVYVCVYTCMFVCIYIYIHIYIGLCAFIDITFKYFAYDYFVLVYFA